MLNTVSTKDIVINITNVQIRIVHKQIHFSESLDVIPAYRYQSGVTVNLRKKKQDD